MQYKQAVNQSNLQLSKHWRSNLLGLLVMLSYGCSADTGQQPEGILSENLNCPTGSVAEFNRWGGMDENSWSHSCVMRHGKYHVWRNGYLAIEGEYEFGKKVGNWILRDKDGAIEKTISYE